MISSRTRQPAAPTPSHTTPPATSSQPRSGGAQAAPQLSIRSANAADLDALVALEKTSFDGDRLSRRTYRSLLDGATTLVMVAQLNGALAGCVVLLFNRSTSIARLYSLAVARRNRGRGIARLLLRAAEHAARERGCALLRLEVRVDNAAARALYASEGFGFVKHIPHYYADGTDAIRAEHSLWDETTHTPLPFLYYAQTLEFTCGAAALMMAMAALKPGLQLDRRLEIRLWREATTVFMASGHGGCGPFGLALAAQKRGFGATVYAPAHGPMFLGGVRDPDKKRVIELVEADFIDELANTPVAVHRGQLRSETLIAHLRRGEVPVVLISLFRLHGEKGLHWITVTGYDSHVFRVLDPMSPPHGGRTPEISIARNEFERMSRYGRQRQGAAVVLRQSPGETLLPALTDRSRHAQPADASAR